MRIFIRVALIIFCFHPLFSPLIAQDWGNLTKYKMENTDLNKKSANQSRTVFFGNSITEAWPQLSASFFDGSQNHICRGISGQTTPQMLVRFRADVVDIHAKTVIILAGINDIAQNTGPISIEETAGNIFSMAEIAKAHGIEVVLCSVLPAYDFPWKEGMEPAEKVRSLNVLLKNYAAKHDLRYVDYYSKMVDKKGGLQNTLTYDGVHPNAEGYKIMETVFLEK